MPTDQDRIVIRRQQIEEIEDMIAWERAHNWGRHTAETSDLSDRVVNAYEHVIATLETVIAYLEAPSGGDVDRH